MDIAVAKRKWVERRDGRMRVVRRSFILRSGDMNSRNRCEDRCRRGLLRIVVVVV